MKMINVLMESDNQLSHDELRNLASLLRNDNRTAMEQLRSGKVPEAMRRAWLDMISHNIDRLANISNKTGFFA